VERTWFVRILKAVTDVIVSHTTERMEMSVKVGVFLINRYRRRYTWNRFLRVCSNSARHLCNRSTNVLLYKISKIVAKTVQQSLRFYGNHFTVMVAFAATMIGDKFMISSIALDDRSDRMKRSIVVSLNVFGYVFGCSYYNRHNMVTSLERNITKFV